MQFITQKETQPYKNVMNIKCFFKNQYRKKITKKLERESY